MVVQLKEYNSAQAIAKDLDKDSARANEFSFQQPHVWAGSIIL